MWWHLDSRNLAGVQSQAPRLVILFSRYQPSNPYFYINLYHSISSIKVVYEFGAKEFNEWWSSWSSSKTKDQGPHLCGRVGLLAAWRDESRWDATDLFPIWSAAPASGQRRNDYHSFWCCFQPILLVWELIYILIYSHLSSFIPDTLNELAMLAWYDIAAAQHAHMLACSTLSHPILFGWQGCLLLFRICILQPQQ